MRTRLRFGVKAYLAATAFLSIAIFGWIRWPMMTASSFVANAHVQPSPDIEVFDDVGDQQSMRDFVRTTQRLNCVLKPMKRSTMDTLLGVQRFDYGPYDITARFGKVTIDGPYWDFGAGKMRR